MRRLGSFARGLACAVVAAALLGPGAAAPAGAQEKVLRFVPHADLKNLDPIWTTALITLNHGYMVYDTLFALDENLQPQPQMVGDWSVSDDGLTYTFTLRDGLRFHDGEPVTTADVIASLKRWAARDVMGQKIMEYTDSLEAVDDGTFKLVLNRPYGLVIDALAKPTAVTPLIMREEEAQTDPYEQVQGVIGSGPFKFVNEEWVPGARVVYVRNEDYVPRDEPPSGLAGSKVVKVDRVEWVIMPDQQTAMSALLAGEVDIYENPPLDFMAIFEGDPDIETRVLDSLGTTGYARPNFLHPPFNDVRARRALLHAVDQEAYLRAAVGDERYFAFCKSYFVCGSPLETLAGAEPYMEQDLDRARELVREAGLEGHKVVVLDPTDNQILHNITLVTVDNLRKIGFDVDVQAMDWATLTSRRPVKEPPERGGWNVFHTWSLGIELSSPAASFPINTTCDGSNWFGWPCDEGLEELRVAWTLATEPEEKKRLAEELHAKLYEFVPYVPAGQWFAPIAYRTEVEGILEGPRFVLWNIEKKGRPSRAGSGESPARLRPGETATMADATTIETGAKPAPTGDPAYGDGIAFVDGEFVPVLEAKVPMLDWGFLRSDACQDTISVWKGSFFRLEQHLERFERSYTRLRMTCPYTRDELRGIATELVRRAGFPDAYVQLIMTRGRPPVGSRDPRQCRNRFQAFCIPYVWIATPEVQERGLRMHVSPRLRVPPRVVDPTIKHYHWLDFEQGLFEAFDVGAETVVLLGEDGNVAEGPGFNVFAVKGGRVTTPDGYVLDGMTRTAVIELCAEDGIPLTLGTVTADELRGADEAFISTTAGGVIPVTVVDGAPIGDGKPGPVTRRLKSLYWSKREAGWHATPIDYGR